MTLPTGYNSFSELYDKIKETKADAGYLNNSEDQFVMSDSGIYFYPNGATTFFFPIRKLLQIIEKEQANLDYSNKLKDLLNE